MLQGLRKILAWYLGQREMSVEGSEAIVTGEILISLLCNGVDGVYAWVFPIFLGNTLSIFDKVDRMTAGIYTQPPEWT